MNTKPGWPHSSQDEIPCVFPVLDDFSLCYFYVINNSWINEGLAAFVVTDYTQNAKHVEAKVDNTLKWRLMQSEGMLKKFEIKKKQHTFILIITVKYFPCV